ncbi:MAG: hypothetical protein IAG13_13160 [Deltaproteobacteria bacterium]|nr:hypothetical protein [Nannocystaceae bacterium]
MSSAEPDAAGAAQAEALAWVRAAGSPAFEDMRNAMHMLGLRLSGVRRAVGEIGPPLAEQLASISSDDGMQAAVAMEELAEAVGEIEGGLELLRTTLGAVEELVIATRRDTRLHEVIGVADQLAQHHARPVGGVRWQPVPIELSIALGRTLAISVLATALSLLGLRLAACKLIGPIVPSYKHSAVSCSVCFTAPLPSEELERCAVALARTFGADPIAISIDGSMLVVEMPRVG